jgi:hypothetical protein
MKLIPVRCRFLSYADGGRVCMPVGDGYAPHACTATGDEYFPVRLNGVPKEATFQSAFEAVLELSYADTLDYTPLMDASEFRLVEGAKTVAWCTYVPG